MYTQFFINNNHQFDRSQLNFQKCIILGNWSMILSFTFVITCIAITFLYEQHFSLVIQIAAHISTIIFAAIFKIAYVIRCVGVHGLGFKVF